MKRLFWVMMPVILSTALMAQQIEVQQVLLTGPVKVVTPLIIDSVDATQTKYDATQALNTTVPLTMARSGAPITTAQCPKNQDTTQQKLYLTQFFFTTQRYADVEVKVSGPTQYKVFVQGKEANGGQGYRPGRYDVVVKYLADTAELKIALKSKDSTFVLVETAGSTEKRPFSMADNMEMNHYYKAQLSSSGKYALVGTTRFDANGKSDYKTRLIEVSTGKVLSANASGEWMPKSDKLIKTRKVDGVTQLISIDPATMQEVVICKEMPAEIGFEMSPTEDFLILMPKQEGPKKETGVYEILTPEDRQPNWRDRTSLAKMDLNTGIVQPLTYTHKNVWLCDISPDGKEILFATSEDRYTQRPTSLNTIYRLNLETMCSEILVDKDGFVSSLSYLPGTTNLITTGSAEAFGGVGRNLPDSLIPNEFEYQMFVMDSRTKEVRPITKDFNPSVEKVRITAQGQIFFTAQNEDSVSLYKVDPKTWVITKIDQPVEVVSGLSVSANGQTILYYGTSACVADRLYSIDKKNQVKLVEDLNAERMAQIKLGTCESFRFMSKNGYELTGHYYLPANMDKTKKYPVIVHYYGGCSPTARRFGGGSHYPAHYWNAMGYVVLVVNPGGASGFGQEWGARHVNTMGEGIAEDIIEATEHFIAGHAWVNADKIGCVSASYGGFMTQLLLTKTDLFATGISHAGISDHTSYWGEGYWGYSYSEVSAANSYPWTRKDLFVDRSPLFNADKIHKPLLFTHGTADTNVPIGESIQMYTALKLLGVPTAFIMVEGENHGIMDYTKRQLWINSMVAWFHKWLQDDPSWWEAMYSKKSL